MDPTERAATVISRYLLAKIRLRKRPVADGIVANDIARSLRDGNRAFYDSIMVDPEAPEIITADARDPDLLRAIVYGQDDAIEIDAGELQQWRAYVVKLEGTAPARKVEET